MKTEFYYAREREKQPYIVLPKIFFTDPDLKSISPEAKLIYSLMLDRASISAVKGFKDDIGRVYIYFTVGETAKFLGCAAEKATKILKELETVNGEGLIDRIKRGKGRAALIFVKRPVPDDEVKTTENRGTCEKDKTPENQGSCEDNKTAENQDTCEDNKITENQGSCEKDKISENRGTCEDNKITENQGTSVRYRNFSPVYDCVVKHNLRKIRPQDIGNSALNNNKYNNTKYNNNKFNNNNSSTQFSLTHEDIDDWLLRCEAELGLRE